MIILKLKTYKSNNQKKRKKVFQLNFKKLKFYIKIELKFWNKE